jgi:hypothetical protein
MARKFNPLEREPAVLQLPSGDYEVAEATRGIMRRVQALQKNIEQLGEDGDDDVAVQLLAELIEAALVDGEGAAAEILEAWNANALSMPALVRTAQFISDELRGSVEAGEA